MSEIEKALVELKALMKFRAERLGCQEEFRALGLTSRKNLCLHPSVRREKSGNVVDALCRSLTAGFIGEKKHKGEDVEVCVCHDVGLPLSRRCRFVDGRALIDGPSSEPRPCRSPQPDSQWRLDPGRPSAVWRAAQAVPLFHLPAHGSYLALGLFCCSFLTFTPQLPYCDVIIYSYHYLLDPKIAERVSKDLSRDSIVVFDEAHNIDNVCIESLSTDITEDPLRRASRGAQNLENKINEMKDSDQQKLQDEYEKLVEGLRGVDDGRQEDSFMANPSKPP